jgi:SpoVK/Ycf46/Vps4 family AAA+-type ATPase
MADQKDISVDLVQSLRLGLNSEVEGMRLFAARLVRKYRQSDPDLSRRIDDHLRAAPAASPMRRRPVVEPETAAFPPGRLSDGEPLALVHMDTTGARKPVLAGKVGTSVQQLLDERRESRKLRSLGLEPVRSAIFVGPPGVGKTMTAKWIAVELGLPLLVLDLTAIMSSLLGKTGNNLRAVLDHAKSIPCVLLLDEIDAIAKRRGDLSDIGELKRLVTVILQEMDAWPSSGLLLAATNHPELIDPAMWRRFDLTLEFPRPERRVVAETIGSLLADHIRQFERWVPTLAILLDGRSFSDIERTIRQFRKAVTLGSATPVQLVEDLTREHSVTLDKASCLELAKHLAMTTRLSQHKISDITGVSRDTIRKYTKREETGLGD